MNVIANDAMPRKVRRALEGAEWQANHGWEYFAALAESPIEMMLLEEIFADYVEGQTDALYLLNCYIHGGERALSCHSIICHPQAEITGYRVDFIIDAFLPGSERQLWAIECDGHQFHDKTKDQAARDKRRDRVLQSEGLKILRYTGSEIYRDPNSIWLEIVDYVTGKRGVQWAHQTR